MFVTGELSLHIPDLAELSYRQCWLADEEFMSFNAGWDVPDPSYNPLTGCVDFPASNWQKFQEHYCSDLQKCGYFYLMLARKTPIGHAHYRVGENRKADIGINIVPTWRGQGYGAIGLRLLIERIRQETQAEVICNEFEPSRIAAVRLHEKLGFVIDETVTITNNGRMINRWLLVSSS